MRLVKSRERLSAFATEFAMANNLDAAGDFDGLFVHAERAHVLGQPWAARHSAAHWLMFKIGVSRGDGREIWGQIVRLAGGGFLSLVGRPPKRNTGGANVPAEQAILVSPYLAEICAADYPRTSRLT